MPLEGILLPADLYSHAPTPYICRCYLALCSRHTREAHSVARLAGLGWNPMHCNLKDLPWV